MSNPSNQCQHLQIASSPVGDVKICPECGVVHVAVQNLSLRLDLESFRALTYMLAQAQLNIEDQQTYNRNQFLASDLMNGIKNKKAH